MSHDAGEQLGDLTALDAPTFDPANDLPQVFDRRAMQSGASWRRFGRRRRGLATPLCVDGLLLLAALVGRRVETAPPAGFRPPVVTATAKRAADVATAVVARMGKDRNAALAAPDQPAAEVRPEAKELAKRDQVAGCDLAGITKTKPIRGKDEGIGEPGYTKARSSRTLSILFICIVPFYLSNGVGGGVGLLLCGWVKLSERRWVNFAERYRSDGPSASDQIHD